MTDQTSALVESRRIVIGIDTHKSCMWRWPWARGASNSAITHLPLMQAATSS